MLLLVMKYMLCVRCSSDLLERSAVQFGIVVV